jgi:hypothetical protein
VGTTSVGGECVKVTLIKVHTDENYKYGLSDILL